MRTRIRRKRRRKTRKGGAALMSPIESTHEEIMAMLHGFPRVELSRAKKIFEKRSRVELEDVLTSLTYIQGLEDSGHPLAKLIQWYKIEPFDDSNASRFLDYRTLGELARGLRKDGKLDLKMTTMMKYLFKKYVFKHPENISFGFAMFQTALIRMFRNAEEMRGYIMACPKLRAPMRVFRGLTLNYRTFVEGQFNSFSSTSLDPIIAENFAGISGFVMELLLPIGFPIACLGLNGEFEITLPPGYSVVQTGPPTRVRGLYIYVPYSITQLSTPEITFHDLTEQIKKHGVSDFQRLFDEAFHSNTGSNNESNNLSQDIIEIMENDWAKSVLLANDSLSYATNEMKKMEKKLPWVSRTSSQVIEKAKIRDESEIVHQPSLEKGVETILDMCLKYHTEIEKLWSNVKDAMKTILELEERMPTISETYRELRNGSNPGLKESIDTLKDYVKTMKEIYVDASKLFDTSRRSYEDAEIAANHKGLTHANRIPLPKRDDWMDGEFVRGAESLPLLDVKNAIHHALRSR